VNAFSIGSQIAELGIAGSDDVLYLFADTREHGLGHAAIPCYQTRSNAVLLLVRQAAQVGFPHCSTDAAERR
jgi:hypothetical protein